MLELSAGSVFGGRYIINKLIGSGGMGAVYLAIDPRYNDFPVALKIIYPGFIKTTEARERFKTEITASYSITHRNVVRPYEYFDQGSTQAYAMEYIDGGDLQMLFKNGAAPIDQAISILRQSAAGLFAIHQRGIIHRDLKPENILVGKKGLVKIADFGVARMRGERDQLTQSGAMVGTPKYFSPEYIENGDMDQRGDIYALGVIGYELIAGISPFRSTSQVSLMVERVKQKPVDLQVVAKNCPIDLAKVIEKSMRLAVKERYQTAEQLRADLECVQQGRALKHWDQPSPNQLEVVTVNEQPSVIPEPVISVATVQTSTSVTKPSVINSTSVSTWLLLCCSFLLVVLVGLGGYYFFYPKQHTLSSSMNVGRYEGYVQGLLLDKEDVRIEIVKSSEAITLKLDGKICVPEIEQARQVFTCNKQQYAMEVDFSDKLSVVGRMWPVDRSYWARWAVHMSNLTH